MVPLLISIITCSKYQRPPVVLTPAKSLTSNTAEYHCFCVSMRLKY